MHRTVAGKGNIFSLYRDCIGFGKVKINTTSEPHACALQGIGDEFLSWTPWSQQTLAAVIGRCHPSDSKRARWQDKR